MNDIITTTATLDIEAASTPDKPPRVSVLAYAGGAMNVPGFGPTVIDLAGLAIADAVTLLADHENALAAVVGTGTPAKKNGTLTIAGTLTTATEAGKQLIALARDGVRLQASVGVHIGDRERIRAGEKIQANGQTVTAPAGGLLLVKAGALREVSITPVGADPATTVSIAANRGKTMTTNPNINESDIRLSERQRLAEIERLCTAPLGGWGTKARRVDELRASALDGEIELDELRAGLVDVLKTGRATAPNIGGDRPAEGNVLEAALCLTAGMSESFVGSQFDERTMNAAVSKPMRNLGIHAVLRSVLRAAGQQVPDRFGSSEIKATFEADRMLRASGTFSTLSLPGILGNVANKSMLESYLGMNVTWNTFCAVAANSDFKTHARYRMTAGGAFEQVGKAALLKHLTMGEESYTNKLSTYGAMIVLTREDIINDDMSAFTKLPKLLGRQSAIALEKAVFTLLLSNPTGGDGFAFFSTDHANYSTSAGVLSIDTLTSMEQAFLELTDDNGDPILITPSTLLVPPALSVTATLLTSSLEIRDTTGSTKYTTENPHAKKFQVAVSPWLTNANLTGNSDTGYYLFARPNDIAAMEVAFLGGNQNPTIESGDTDFNTLGMAWRAYHDFGVALQDFRAGVFYDGTT